MKRPLLKSLVVLSFIFSTFALTTLAQANTRFEWRRDAYDQMRCAEVTLRGALIQFVDSDRCRFSQEGSRFEWRRNAYDQMRCAEVTPGGSLIQFVDNSLCR